VADFDLREFQAEQGIATQQQARSDEQFSDILGAGIQGARIFLPQGQGNLGTGILDTLGRRQTGTGIDPSRFTFSKPGKNPLIRGRFLQR